MNPVSSYISRTLTLALLVLVFCAGTFSTVAHAQGNQPAPPTPPTATNQALALTESQDLAKSLWKECYSKDAAGEYKYKVSLTRCEFTNTSNIKTVCNTDVGLNGDYCIFTYPDKSRVEADPNFSGFSTTFKNYNSEGVLVGRDNTGLGGSTTGTLQGSSINNGSQGGVCGIARLDLCLLNLPGYLLVALAELALMIAAMILQIVGVLFNWTIIRTVFQFGTYFGTSDGMLLAWGIMRDIANITLLFGFIFMGVALILNLEGGGHGHGGGMSPRRAIPRLIIFAILLNFSLFASQVVIDVANSFSSVLATQAGQDTCKEGTTGSATSQSLEDCANVGISGQVMAIAGISTIWAPDNLKNFIQKPYSKAMVLLLLSIFVLVTAVVLLAGCLMLIARAVILSFLMIVSPVGFAAMAIPPLKKIATQWWHTLLSQAFFAPIYLLLVLISLKVGGGIAANPDGQVSLANALIGNGGTSTAGNMQIILVFAVVIGFMVASLLAAKKFGAMGADWGVSTAGAVIGGGTVGLAGFAARRTIGAGAAHAIHSDTFQKFARSNPALGRLAYSGLNKATTASFDARGAIKGAPIPLGTVSKAASHGYHGIEEAAVKARTDFAENGLKQTHTEEARQEELEEKRGQEEARKNAANRGWQTRKTQLEGAVTQAKRGVETQQEVTNTAEKKKKEQETLVQGAETAYTEKVAEAQNTDGAIASQQTLIQQAEAAVTAQQQLIQQTEEAVAAQQLVLQKAWTTGDPAARAAASAELASRQQAAEEAKTALTSLQETVQQAQTGLEPLEQNKQRIASELVTFAGTRDAAAARLQDLSRIHTQEAQTLETRKQEVTDATTALDTGKRDHDTTVRAIDKEIEAINVEIKGGDILDDEGKVVSSMPGINMDAIRTQHAEAMKTEFAPPLTMAKHANKEGAKKILKRVRRDGNEKLIDAIKESSGGGGGAAKAAAAHAPAAAPAGGGHDH